MTPTRLARLLAARADTRDLSNLTAADRAVALERACEHSPADRSLQQLLTASQDQVVLQTAPPTPVDGLHLRTLLRWDAWSATYEGFISETGEEVLARVLRPVARTPFYRRRLAREGRVLLALYPDLVAYPGALVVRAPGGPLLEGTPPRQDLALRAVLRVLADLARREALDLAPIEPDTRELRLCDEGARLICLHIDHSEPGQIITVLDALETLAPPRPIAHLFAASRTFPPRTAEDLVELVINALAQDLAAQRHALVQRFRSRRDAHDRARLRALTLRLAHHPPPAGRGAVGVDLEGRPTVLAGDGYTLSWGPLGGPMLAVVSDQGLHPRTARRMLRARASAPPSERLHRLVSGDPAYTERACRWVAAALSLRTIRLLLEVPA